jgi:hypothetical protein
MLSSRHPSRSPLLEVVMVDNSIPIAPEAAELWLTDLERRSRWFIRPLLQGFFVIILYITWAFKRLPLPQFSAHNFLQRMICFFCKYFVSPEANELIVRHFTTESNILNFLHENTEHEDFEPMSLYPKNIEDMMTHTFVDHDQEFRAFLFQGDLFQGNRIQHRVFGIFFRLELDEIAFEDRRGID